VGLNNRLTTRSDETLTPKPKIRRFSGERQFKNVDDFRFSRQSSVRARIYNLFHPIREVRREPLAVRFGLHRMRAHFPFSREHIMKTIPLSHLLTLTLVVGASTAARSAPLPDNLVGKWAMTTISGTTYWDKSTGAYAGSGNGGAQTYTFSSDGRYKLFSLLKTNVYGWETQALTWEEGTVAVKDDALTLRPTSGRYQVMDNRVSKNNYKRPMRASERKISLLFWKLETQSGKPVLLMGRSRDGLLTFKKQP
jgi:hypothetical protein